MKIIFKKYTALICALCAVMLVISGCALEDLQVAKQKKVKPGTGTVTLLINGANARTIFPEEGYLSYEVKAHYSDADGGAQYGLTEYVTDGSLEISFPIATEFEISVKAYDAVVKNVAEAEDANVVAEGSVIILATDLTRVGATIYKRIILVDENATGEGIFEWEISYGPTVVKAEMAITDADGDPVTIDGNTTVVLYQDDDATLTTPRDTSVDLAAGAYLVKFTITYNTDGLGTTDTISFVEDLYIISDMTSKYKGFFNNFNPKDALDYVIDAFKTGNWAQKLAKLRKENFDDLGVKYGDDFNAVKAGFEFIIGSTTSLNPADLNDITALVDAALVRAGIDSLYDSLADAKAAVDALPLNGNTVVYSDLERATLPIKFGKYAVSARLDVSKGAIDSYINASYQAAAGTTKVWSLTDWFKDDPERQWTMANGTPETNNGNEMKDNEPLNQAGGGTGETGMLILAANDGINVTKRANGWDAVDIVLLAGGTEPPPTGQHYKWTDGLSLVPAEKSYKITVYGVMLTSPSSGEMRFRFDTANQHPNVQAVSGQDAIFKLSYYLPSTFATGPDHSIRVVHSTGTQNFRITLIEVEESDYDACECVGCDLNGKKITDSISSTFCTCEATHGVLCTERCPVCEAKGPMTVENGFYDKILSAQFVPKGTKVFSMVDWFSGDFPYTGGGVPKTAAALDNAQQAVNIPFYRNGGTLNLVNGGINAVNRPGNVWETLDIILTSNGNGVESVATDGLNLDTATKKYTVTAYGVMLANTNNTMIGFQKARNANHLKGRGEETVGDIIVSGTNAQFKLVYVLPYDFTSDGFYRLRMKTDNPGTAPYRLSLVEVEEEAWAPCTCEGCALITKGVSDPVTLDQYGFPTLICTNAALAVTNNCDVCKLIGVAPDEITIDPDNWVVGGAATKSGNTISCLTQTFSFGYKILPPVDLTPYKAIKIFYTVVNPGTGGNNQGKKFEVMQQLKKADWSNLGGNNRVALGNRQNQDDLVGYSIDISTAVKADIGGFEFDINENWGDYALDYILRFEKIFLIK